MAEQKPCVRCERAIDAYARICPYCNWDQGEAVPPPSQQQSSVPAYVPPQERNWRRHMIIGAIGVAVLVASFAVGALIQGGSKNAVTDRDLNEDDTPQVTGNVGTAPRSDVTLVPLEDGASLDADAPITSAPLINPAEGVPTEYQRSDATAVSSVEYAQLAVRAQQERAQQEKKRQQALVDPRTLTGAAYNQGARPAPRPATAPGNQPPMSSSGEPQTAQQQQQRQQQQEQQQQQQSPAAQPSREPARVIVSTRPIPEYQPIPNISVRETTVARLELVIGPDGRVKDVMMRSGIPGQTAKLISTVQTWRFKPATENGVPVSASVPVDISFRGNQ